MYILRLSRKLWVFKIIIIYVIFHIIYIKNWKNVIRQMMMCMPCMSNYYLCDFYKNYRE
jgi:hypothetical protein